MLVRRLPTIAEIAVALGCTLEEFMALPEWDRAELAWDYSESLDWEELAI